MQYKVALGYIPAGARNQRNIPGYWLENGEQLVDWLKIGAGGEGLYLSLLDYMDAQLARRKDCLAYKPIANQDGQVVAFELTAVAIIPQAPRPAISCPCRAWPLHTGQTPVELPRTARPFVDNEGAMLGWYDTGTTERR